MRFVAKASKSIEMDYEAPLFQPLNILHSCVRSSSARSLFFIVQFRSPGSGGCLFVLHLLRELLVVLLEAVADAGLGGHPLEDTAVEAAAFLRRDGLGGEVVNARVEAVLNEAAKSLLI